MNNVSTRFSSDRKTWYVCSRAGIIDYFKTNNEQQAIRIAQKANQIFSIIPYANVRDVIKIVTDHDKVEHTY